MANYFSYLPDVFVRTSSYRTGSNDPYVQAKNLFRRIKMRDDISDIILGFEKYIIQHNERPDQIAGRVYGNVEYDWVVLITNNIINIYDEWPMTEQEMYSYMVRKYGKDDVDGVHHWVTQEIKNTQGDTVLKAGFEVPQDFQYSRSDGTVVPKEELVRPISNYDHESQLNDYKRGIHLLKPQYISAFVEEFEKLVEYLPSNEIDVATGIKKTVNIVAEAFTNVKPTYQTLVGQTPSISFASQQEYTSRSFGSTDPTISAGDVLADGSTVVEVTPALLNATLEVAGQMDSNETQEEVIVDETSSSTPSATLEVAGDMNTTTETNQSGSGGSTGETVVSYGGY